MLLEVFYGTDLIPRRIYSLRDELCYYEKMFISLHLPTYHDFPVRRKKIIGPASRLVEGL